MAHTRLPDVIPEGLLVNRQWLRENGFSRPTVDYYLRTGALLAVVRGVYRRPGPPLKWENIVCSLLSQGYDLHVGGAKALTDGGHGHFVAMAKVTEIHLYASGKLPDWLSDWHTLSALPGKPYRFMLHRQPWLKEIPEQFMTVRQYGQWDWPLRYATPELATMEYLVEVETEMDFHQMDRWFESLTILSPVKLQQLLTLCPSVKARRLFGWFAERHGHAWYNKLDWSQVNLGSGKRSVIAGGGYNSKWQITVPRMMESRGGYGSEQPLF